MIDYSIGIPVRNEENTLDICVKHALAQTVTPAQILVCLNGSNTPTRSLAKRLAQEHPTVRLLESHPGKPYAWNEIVKRSATNQIYFTDGDAFLNPAAAQLSLDAFASQPTACVTGGDLFYLKPPNPSLLLLAVHNKFNRRVKVNNISGANYMIRREELLKLGYEVGIHFMPPDAVHEDILVGTVARKHGAFVHNESIASVFPTSTLRDYFRQVVRVKKSLAQLETKYPDYFRDGKVLAPLDYRRKPINPLFSAIKFATYVAARAYIALDRTSQSTLWTELSSTKPQLVKSK